MAQKHSQLDPRSPCFRLEPPTQGVKTSPFENIKARRKHKSVVHSSPQKNGPRQGNRNRLTENNRNTSKNELLPQHSAPKKTRPRKEHSTKGPRGSPKNPLSSLKSSRQSCAFVEHEPDVNDVVCCSIPFRKRPRGVIVIQPNCKHEGNLAFETVVWNTAHRYTKAMASLSKNPTLSDSLESISEKLQKKLTGIIAAKIVSKGGCFLVWTKEDTDRVEYANNGSWHLVGKNDILNMCRYSLLTRVNAIQKAPEDKYKQQSSTVEELEFEKESASKKAHENDDSTATTVDASSYSNDSIVNILSEFDLSSDSDNIDYWLASPEPKGRKMLCEVHCWDYKLLLPSQIA